jgi:hypothetical protein
MFTRTFDEASGILTIHASDVWTLDEMREHLAAMDVLLADLRGRDVRVRVIADLTEVPLDTLPLDPVSPEQAAILRLALERITSVYGPGDRLALLTTDLHKTYLRGLVNDVAVATFSSRMAAEMWLLADDLPVDFSEQGHAGAA